jgi:preprotein translocase subunit SecE
MVMLDKVKIAVAFLLAAAGIAGFYWFADSPMILRVSMVLGGLGLGFAAFWLSVPGKAFVVYAEESAAETRKVVWPTRKETLQTTGIVFVFVVVMALFLWMVDASLLWVVKKLIGQGE